MRRKLTPWFPPEVKPVRPASLFRREWYRRWDGERWGVGGATKAEAATEQDGIERVFQDSIHWRGLAEQPK